MIGSLERYGFAHKGFGLLGRGPYEARGDRWRRQSGEALEAFLMSRRLVPAAAAARMASSSAAAAAVSGGAEGGGGEGRGGDTLGRRLLKLIYPKRSAAVVLRRWAEEGRTVQKYQLNRVVRELRKYRRFKHALEVHNRHGRGGGGGARHLFVVLPA